MRDGGGLKEADLVLPQGLFNLVGRTGLVNRSLEYETGHTLCREKGTNSVCGAFRGEKNQIWLALLQAGFMNWSLKDG